MTPHDSTRLIESLWVHTRHHAAAGVRITPRPAPPTDRAAGLARIRAALGDCQRCALCAGRCNLVFGAGDPEARLVFVGDCPTAEDDRCGDPFVDDAGQLLTKIIAAIGLTRDQVYLTSVVKCRPPEGRRPRPAELRTCLPFLEQQLAVLQPAVIVALGAVAAGVLLESDEPITRLRGRFHPRGRAVVMPTYHPAYLLRSPSHKKETWIDMQQVQRRYLGSGAGS